MEESKWMDKLEVYEYAWKDLGKEPNRLDYFKAGYTSGKAENKPTREQLVDLLIKYQRHLGYPIVYNDVVEWVANNHKL